MRGFEEDFIAYHSGEDAPSLPLPQKENASYSSHTSLHLLDIIMQIVYDINPVTKWTQVSHRSGLSDVERLLKRHHCSEQGHPGPAPHSCRHLSPTLAS